MERLPRRRPSAPYVSKLTLAALSWTSLVFSPSTLAQKMMSLQNLQIATLSAVLLMGSAIPAVAQAVAPFGGAVAIGGAFGGAVPTADRLDNGFYAGGGILVAVASHVSLSAEAGADHVAIDRPGFRSDLMPRFADIGALVHWRSDPFRPFLTGGVGIYRYTINVSSQSFSDPSLRNELVSLGLTPSSRGSIQVRHDEPGINLGGGFDYFFTRRSALTMDLRAHATRTFVEVAPLGGVFVNIAIGFRQYF
jgi:hypothetical protein